MMHLPLSMEGLNTLPLTTTNGLPLSAEGVSLDFTDALEMPSSSAASFVVKSLCPLGCCKGSEVGSASASGLGTFHQPVPFFRNIGD